MSITELIIYNSALERLKLKFEFAQAEKLAKFMIAQAKHETAGFTSKVFKTNNNAFGYKYYKGSIYQLSKGLNSPEGDSYAKYNSVEDSSKEVADWLGRRKDKFKGVITIEDYSKQLKESKYYGDSLANYTNALKRWFAGLGQYVSNKIEGVKKKSFSAFTWVILLTSLLGLFWFIKRKKHG